MGIPGGDIAIRGVAEQSFGDERVGVGGVEPGGEDASRSSPPAGGESIEIIFCQGVYLTENTAPALSVRSARGGP